MAIPVIRVIRGSVRVYLSGSCPIPEGHLAHRLPVAQYRPALPTMDQFKDIVKVLGEVAEHVRRCLSRVGRPENKGR
jgi:hypothetical protein